MRNASILVVPILALLSAPAIAAEPLALPDTIVTPGAVGPSASVAPAKPTLQAKIGAAAWRWALQRIAGAP